MRPPGGKLTRGRNADLRLRRGLPRPCVCLRDDLGELDQVAGRVCEKGELAADRVEFERLGDDFDAAGSKVGDGLFDIRHVDAEVVIAGVAETIAKVSVSRGFNWQRIAATQQLDQERVVVRGSDVGEVFVAVSALRGSPAGLRLACDGFAQDGCNVWVVELARGEQGMAAFVLSRIRARRQEPLHAIKPA